MHRQSIWFYISLLEANYSGEVQPVGRQPDTTSGNIFYPLLGVVGFLGGHPLVAGWYNSFILSMFLMCLHFNHIWPGLNSDIYSSM